MTKDLILSSVFGATTRQNKAKIPATTVFQVHTCV